VKETYLYKKLPNKKVQCRTCAHFCVLALGERGKCGVRENIDGKLYSLVYGKIVAMNIDPIEKKPFYHFLPGSQSLSIATVGCPLQCLNCQNYEISQAFKGAKEIPGEEIPPKKIVEIALKNNLPSISYTYTDPIAFLEYALDTMKLAKKARLKNNFVSNGFMSEESAKLVIPYLDAINIDIKGFTEDFYQKVCGARLKPVLETAKLMKKSGVWVEITTLVIPTLNDDEKTFEGIAKWIFENLGPETPWHISQFCGQISWKLQHIPDTPVETLEKAIEIGKKVGLKYVYIGNIPGHKAENTYCPKCGTLAINRINYFIHRYDKNGKCPKCGESLNLVLK
jgi:pyruvate formate lyase activating enzyme